MAKLAIVIFCAVIATDYTRGQEDWRSVFLAKDNKYRARHGESPFVLMKELNEGAQNWADILAARCQEDAKTFHSSQSDPIRQLKGETQGESIFGSGGDTENATSSAISASSSWYEEVKHYPYPKVYVGGMKLTGAIGHFTQTVWKDTKYVGYGYKFNKDCKKYTHFVVARYFPSGNYKGEYGENVSPLKV